MFNGKYPNDLNKCVFRAKERGYKYISANSQDGKPACTFYNDKGIYDKSSLNKGNVVDESSSTDTDTKLYYVMP